MDEIQLLQRLIQIPSFSGHEKKLAEFIVNYCKNNNLDVLTQDGNVIVYIKGKNRIKTVIFNAHMDTVNIGNRANWKYSPTGKNAGKIVDGKIYGLGASDDKASIAVMMLLAKLENKPPCDLWFTFVCSEETDGSGTENFLKWFTKLKSYSRYHSKAAVIGEPTDLSSIEIGHRGNMIIQLTSTGISGHGAEMYSSNKLAISKMIKAIEKLQFEFSIWKRVFRNRILGEPNFNITNLNTPDKFSNIIPAQCNATIDIRTTPKLHKKLDLLLKKTAGNYISTFSIKSNTYPCIINPTKSSLVRVCKKILPDCILSISIGTTDLSQFTNRGIEAIVLGPGNKEMMHKEDEFIELDNLRKTVDIYRKIIWAYANE